MEEREVPEGWALARVGDYFSAWGGATPASDNPAFWDGHIPWISSKDIKQFRISSGTRYVTEFALQSTRFRLCPPGTVLVVVRSGVLAHSLPVAITDADVVINQDIKALSSPDRALNEWLVLAIRAHSQEILAQGRKDGTTVQSINSGDLASLGIAVPPLAEQRRIVAKLEETLAQATSARERLAKVPAILKRFRQSVLASACSGRLTEGWREENQPSADGWQLVQIAGDESEVPASWEVTTLDPSALLVTSGSRGWAQYYSDSGATFIRAQNINADVLDLEDVAFVRLPEGAEGRRTRVQDGDLLITITGANVTKSARVVGDPGEAYVSQHVGLVRFSDPSVAPFLFLWTISPGHGRAHLLDAAYGAGKPGLNLTNIREMPIALPTAEERQEIVRRAEALFAWADAVERRVEVARAQVNRLTQAVLAKAFRGELVPTEAELARREGREYEPASVLLERIKKD
jgi:type I restriction enzyme S subunit